MHLPLPSFRVRTVAIGCALAVALAGCSVLPKNVPVQLWQPPESNAAPAAPAGNFSLRVDTPNTTGSLDRPGIVVLPAPGKVSVYKGAQWSEAPALLVRHRLVDAFMAARLPAVTTDDDRFVSDYTLSGDLRAFQTEYRAGAPVVIVRYDAQLRRSGARHLLATHSFVITETPSGSAIPRIVAAFGAADDRLAQQVVAWTRAVVNRTAAAPPAAGGNPAGR